MRRGKDRVRAMINLPPEYLKAKSKSTEDEVTRKENWKMRCLAAIKTFSGSPASRCFSFVNVCCQDKDNTACGLV